MSRPFDHREPGTDEDEWRDVEPWRGAAELVVDAERLVVLAAHPDDETLGAGGLLAVADRAGLEITVVIATDGERSPADPDTATRRRGESRRALELLARSARLVFLGLPDGGLREHRPLLATQVAAAVASDRRTMVATTWWGDGHRDHRVLGEVAYDLEAPGVRVVGYPIWMWHWGEPLAVDASTWTTLALDTETRTAKAAAIAAHASQLEGSGDEPPLLHARMRAHFTRDVEVFLEAARPPASVDVAEFDAFFRRHDDPWGFESRWYEQRKRALLMAVLPQHHVGRAVELGCATGIITAELAARATEVVAVDGSEEALRRAAERVSAPGVRFVRGILPVDWPPGTFDLVVLSEIAYYWSTTDLDRALAAIDAGLASGGALVACHWRHPIEGAPSDGDAVHARIAAYPGWTRTVRHEEVDFVLEVYAR